jgi:glutathione S-transferase
MIVYGSSLSPYVRKLLAYGAEKGLSFELKPSGMGRGGPDFAECSPFGKMPAFRDPGADDGRDFCISDSTAIITYLEAKHPTPEMIPTDPIPRARTIWWDEFADTILTAAGTKLFFNRFVAPRVLKIPGDEAVAAAAEAKELPPLFDHLEQAIPPSGFLVADRLTLADIAVASPFANLDYVGCPIDAARWPVLAGYVAAIQARPGFARLIAQERAMLAAMG